MHYTYSTLSHHCHLGLEVVQTRSPTSIWRSCKFKTDLVPCRHRFDSNSFNVGLHINQVTFKIKQRLTSKSCVKDQNRTHTFQWGGTERLPLPIRTLEFLVDCQHFHHNYGHLMVYTSNQWCCQSWLAQFYVETSLKMH